MTFYLAQPRLIPTHVLTTPYHVFLFLVSSPFVSLILWSPSLCPPLT